MVARLRLLILWGASLFGSVLLTEGSMLFATTFSLSRADSGPERFPFFLPPKSERLLIGLHFILPSGHKAFSAAVYTEPHLSMIESFGRFQHQQTDIWHPDMKFLWGGEFRLTNPTDESRMSPITRINHTSSYLFKLPPESVISNDAHAFIEWLREHRPELVAPDLEVIAFREESMHLNADLDALKANYPLKTNLRHEFNNALTPLMGFSNLIRDQGVNERAVSGFVRSLQHPSVKLIDWAARYLTQESLVDADRKLFRAYLEIIEKVKVGDEMDLANWKILADATVRLNKSLNGDPRATYFVFEEPLDMGDPEIVASVEQDLGGVFYIGRAGCPDILSALAHRLEKTQ